MDVTLVLTHDCNLGCGYCYMGAKFNKRMSPEVAQKALDLAFGTGSTRIQISFFGGEPLLAWDQLVTSATEARERAGRDGVDLKMSVTTNGTLLDRERGRILEDLGVYVGLSIDGIQAAHEAGRPMMGGGSSWAGVANGLEVLLERGTAFETISVVTPTNARWLGETVQWLFDKGVPRVGLNPCYEAAFEDAELEVYGKGLEQAADLFVAHFRAGRIVSMPVFDNKILAALKGGLAKEDKCSLGASSVAIAPSGNIYPCEREVAEDENHQFVMGNVLSSGLTVQGEACERGPKNEECVSCGENWRCASFCACANKAETGRTDVAGGTQCWHERKTAELADRIAETLWNERNVPFLAWFYGRVTSLGAVMAEGGPVKRGKANEIARAPRASNEGKRLKVLQ